MGRIVATRSLLRNCQKDSLAAPFDDDASVIHVPHALAVVPSFACWGVEFSTGMKRAFATVVEAPPRTTNDFENGVVDLRTSCGLHAV